jgi:hypothetical protein
MCINHDLDVHQAAMMRRRTCIQYDITNNYKMTLLIIIKF